MFRIALKGILGRKARLVLTSLAVILGTAFLSGTSVFSATLNRTFDDLFSDVFKNVDAYVRSSQVIEADFGQEERQRIPVSLVDAVKSVPGVSDAAPDIQAFARIIGSDGKPLGADGNGPPTFGGIYTKFEGALWTIQQGKAPMNGNEAAIDEASAKTGKLNVGDKVKIVAQSGSREFTLVGIASYGDVRSPGGATFALFDPTTAAEFLTKPGYIDDILVTGDGSKSDSELATAIQKALPTDVKTETLTGEEITKETQDQIGQFINIIGTFLTIFGFIALIVGGFVINNVFSISAAQRQRENALLRALGASKNQITGTILVESAFVGVLGSVLGFFMGIGFAKLLQIGLPKLGFDLPSGGLIVNQTAFLISFITGVIVTIVSGLLPAFRASRVPPLAAMRETAIEVNYHRIDITILVQFIPAAIISNILGMVTIPQLTVLYFIAAFVGVRMVWSRTINRHIIIRRLIPVFVSIGIALISLIAVLTGASNNLLGVTVGFAFLAVIIAGPYIALPTALFIGRPIAATRGITGKMARQNSARNPIRTARTASPVLIGVALITSVSALAASISGKIDSVFADQFKGDYVVNTNNRGFGGLSPSLATDLAKLPEVQQATGIGLVTAKLDGKGQYITTISPDTIDGVWDLGLNNAKYSDLATNSIFISQKRADKKGFTMGSVINAEFADGTIRPLTISGFYEHNEIGDYVVSKDLIADTTVISFDVGVYISTKDGVSADKASTVLTAAVAKYGQGELLSKKDYIKKQSGSVTQFLSVIYALLALSLLIATLGVVITLLLSVFERQRELGLLRAVGMTQSQVRTTVRWETVITALLGVFLGVVLGIGLGWVIVYVLKDQGLDNFELPVSTVLKIMVSSFLVALFAAIYPAWRATKVDILNALNTN